MAASRGVALGADIPERFGPPTTCYNRFVRWRKLGVWDRIFEAVSAAYDGELQMVDSSSVRVHQHGADATSVAACTGIGSGKPRAAIL